jgi:hypothetical protein
VDLDLLMPELDDEDAMPSLEGRGMHRIHLTTEICVSEDTMSLKRETDSLTGGGRGETWAEAWAVRPSTAPPLDSSISNGSGSSDHGSTTSIVVTPLSPPRKPSKVMLRQDDSPV